MVTRADLQLNSRMRYAKYMLITISAMFMLTAILLLMVGTTIQAIFGDFDSFLDNRMSCPPALLVATGFILLLVAGFGGYGAIKESVMLINLYGLFLFAVVIIELSAAIFAFAVRGQINEMLNQSMKSSLAAYNESTYIKEAVDFVQVNLECCGVDSPNDWMDLGVEDPCPDLTNLSNGSEIVGCLPRLEFIISQSMVLVATCAITVAFVQLLGSFCAFALAKSLRHNKSIREVRRWQMQQSLGVFLAGDKHAGPITNPMNGYTQLEKAETYAANSPSVF